MQKSKKSVQPIDYSHKILTVPNILSLLRIALIPLLCVLYFAKKDGLAAGILLGVSALTDVIDGFIARRFNMISNFGKALDPVADKLTQMVAGAAIAVRFPQMIIVMVVLFIKEISSILAGMIIMKSGRKIPHSVMIGKVTTFLLYGTMGLLLLWPAIPNLLVWVLCIACTISLLWAFITYAAMYIRIMKTPLEK